MSSSHTYTPVMFQRTVITFSDERPYDLGPRENWKAIWRLPLMASQEIREVSMIPPQVNSD